MDIPFTVKSGRFGAGVDIAVDRLDVVDLDGEGEVDVELEVLGGFDPETVAVTVVAGTFAALPADTAEDV